jgi:hypothetical protein
MILLHFFFLYTGLRSLFVIFTIAVTVIPEVVVECIVPSVTYNVVITLVTIVHWLDPVRTSLRTRGA